MLNNIRYKIGVYYMKKADEQIKERKFKEGFKNIKRAVRIVPPSKELTRFAKDLADITTKHIYTN